jgi:EF hand/EF-hand domain pair
MPTHRTLALAAAVALSTGALLGTGAQAQAVFDLIDTDQDGFVSRTELDGERSSRFQMLDRNADGFVDRQEMMVGPGQGRRGYSAGEAQAMLATYDMDGNGRIDSAEVAESLARTDVFTNLDTNADGRIDRAEAAGALDTRPRDGIPHDQIVSELSQGLRTTAGFRPITAQPTQPASAVSIDDGSYPLNPSLLPGYDPYGLDGQAAIPRWNGDGVDNWSDTMPMPDGPPEGRSGYVGRTIDPQTGQVPMWQEGAVPPGPMGGTPYRPTEGAPPAYANGEVYTIDPNAAAGAPTGLVPGQQGVNWREVPTDPAAAGLVVQGAPSSTLEPQPRKGFFARLLGN